MNYFNFKTEYEKTAEFEANVFLEIIVNNVFLKRIKTPNLVYNVLK
ncbi:hypothetical protein HNQ02_001790 [Flavobacterium sp. 7E]|nr:hypothetical protein [Flavobacterium sp. 7E]NRS88872.1 hypothetical protein [Flavobacterium sp. 7E]